ncbi:hypothetical protein FQA39_LY00394 [Lamprigera yunnana]|nr:hypothetical protein FQA39_LY00394 [Lamprigera yunnana]
MYLYGALSSTFAVASTPKQNDLVLGLLKQIIIKQNIIQAALLQLVNNVNYLKTKENVKQKLAAVINSIFPVFNIPLKDDENLLQLEQYLENGKQTNDTVFIVYGYLYSILLLTNFLDLRIINYQESEDSMDRDFIKRVTAMVLLNELASQYSWLG